MTVKDPELISKSIYYQLADLFEISAIYTHNGRLIFRVRPYADRESAVEKMHSRLGAAGFIADVKDDAAGLLIIVKKDDSLKIPWINIILFLATLLTMFLAPLMWRLDVDVFLNPKAILSYLGSPEAFRESFEFTIALITILLFHEFGHYLAGRRRGVFMSLPYFLPAPNIAGTFGAIIKSRSPITNRRDLIEVGATGPLAGFVIAVIVISIGFADARLLEISTEGWSLGESLLIRFLGWLIIGPLPDGYAIELSPIIFAGWVGLLVTMLNLLPLGQLDGGHIIYGLFGPAQHRLGRLFFAMMLALGFWWPGWWFFGILVFLFGIKHPPTVNDSMKVPRLTRLIGYLAIIIFVISFVPVPFS
ncbi:MAG: site-2 protease family protein [Candidatus Zixiibacteriota bacterium]